MQCSARGRLQRPAVVTLAAFLIAGSVVRSASGALPEVPDGFKIRLGWKPIPTDGSLAIVIDERCSLDATSIRPYDRSKYTGGRNCAGVGWPFQADVGWKA
jgi:hypothetical protein